MDLPPPLLKSQEISTLSEFIEFSFLTIEKEEEEV